MKKITFSLSIFLVLVLGLVSCGPAKTTEETVVETTDRVGGLALYTLRDSMAINPKTTLKAVADAGYAYVESADYAEGKFYGMTPAEFKSTRLTRLNRHFCAHGHGHFGKCRPTHR